MTDLKTTDLDPCPFCKYRDISMHIYRPGVAYLVCENSNCGAKIELDMHSWAGAPMGKIIDTLIERWNRRADE